MLCPAGVFENGSVGTTGQGRTWRSVPVRFVSWRRLDQRHDARSVGQSGGAEPLQQGHAEGTWDERVVIRTLRQRRGAASSLFRDLRMRSPGTCCRGGSMKRYFAALLLALPFVVTMAPLVADTIHAIRHTLSDFVSLPREP